MGAKEAQSLTEMRCRLHKLALEHEHLKSTGEWAGAHEVLVRFLRLETEIEELQRRLAVAALAIYQRHDAVEAIA